MAIPGRIIGNLDCEVELAREEARARERRGEPAAGDPGFDLPHQVARSIAALATLLRALAREGDRIWTGLPVAAERMAAVPGLPSPVLESGPLRSLEPAEEILAWGETRAVEAERSRSVPAVVPAGGSPEREPSSIERRLRAVRPSPPAAAARAGHRRFCLEAARSLGLALPGARMVKTLGEIEAHLEAGGAAASPTEGWVLKAPLSAAGRSRLRGRGRPLDPASVRRAERLLDLFGELLFEPWMDRTADFGSPAIAGERGVELLGLHGLEVDPGGVFRGITVPPRGSAPAGLSSEETLLLERTTLAVGELLREAGYRGPFGLDGWRYRDISGSAQFQPLGEINGRMTMGLLARALVERLRGTGLLDPRAAIRMRMGRGEGWRSAGSEVRRAIPLLLPAPGEATSAWLEVGPPGPPEAAPRY
jgi:hypothetical protein